MKRRLVIFLIAIITAIGFCIILSSCGNGNSATIEKIEGASLNGSEVFMYVDSTTDEVSLSDKVKCSNKSVWKLYYDSLGQTEIPTKIATGKNGKLQDGNNIFYIVVNSQDGTNTNTYQLTIYRSYAVNIYFHSNESILRTEKAFTGVEYSVDYVPNLTGYIFNGWKTFNGESISEFIPWDSTHFYADTTPLNFEVTLDVNGGDTLETTNISLVYGESVTLPIPTRTGYTFVGWYMSNIALTDNTGKTLSNWEASISSVITAHWEILHLSVTINRNDLEAGTVTGSGTYDYGTDITLGSSTNKGYNFIGWFDKDDNLISENATYSFKVTEDITVVAKWNYYTLTTATNNPAAGNTTTYTARKVSIGEEATLNAETYIGYVWLGWYENDLLVSNDITLTFKMPNKNVVYVATWELDKRLENLEYTLSRTKCEVTGVKDKSVTEIEVPDYVTYIQLGAFTGCGQLIKLSLPFIGSSINNSSQQVLGHMFGTNSYEGSIAIKQRYNVLSTGTSYSGTFYLPSSLRKVNVNDGYITASFNGCANLTSITLPENLTEIGMYSFYDCSNLTSISIPSSVSTIKDYAFSGCSALSAVYITDIPAWCDITFGDYSNPLYYAHYLYVNNELITSIIIPEGITTINDSVFYKCYNLETVVLPTSVISIGQSAFAYCSNLNSINIPQNLTSIGSYAFTSCSSLESITLPDSVDSIGKNSFSNCSRLTSINIPDGVTLIEDWAFYYCTNLKEITIGVNVQSIGKWAFSICNSLQKVYYRGTEKQWNNIYINTDGNSNISSATHYYYSKEYPFSDTVMSGNFWHYVDSKIVIWVKED